MSAILFTVYPLTCARRWRSTWKPTSSVMAGRPKPGVSPPGIGELQFEMSCFSYLLTALLLAPALGSASPAASSKPNILIILADQWRAQAFGFAGDPNVKTPNLDRLQRQSFWFANAIAGVPVCCPTRASLLTGQRAVTHGVFLNDVPLATNAVTLAKVLAAAGYDTGYIGKWHLNGDGRSDFIPRERRQGFDYWKVLECTHDYTNSNYYSDRPEKLK